MIPLMLAGTLALVCFLPTRVATQADSARADSARPDSAKIDSTRADSATVRIVDGDPYLLATARSSVARWRFRPMELLPGCRVRARTLETVTF